MTKTNHQKTVKNFKELQKYRKTIKKGKKVTKP